LPCSALANPPPPPPPLPQAHERLAQAYDEIRGGKAEDMRQQELLRSQMALAYRMGDTATALKLQQLLLPDHMRPDGGTAGKK
jgi:hypothetical protein